MKVHELINQLKVVNQEAEINLCLWEPGGPYRIGTNEVYFRVYNEGGDVWLQNRSKDTP